RRRRVGRDDLVQAVGDLRRGERARLGGVPLHEPLVERARELVARDGAVLVRIGGCEERGADAAASPPPPPRPCGAAGAGACAVSCTSAPDNISAVPAAMASEVLTRIAISSRRYGSM